MDERILITNWVLSLRSLLEAIQHRDEDAAGEASRNSNCANDDD